MEGEAHIFSIGYFGAVCTRAVLLLYSVCEDLAVCHPAPSSQWHFLRERLLGFISHGEEQRGLVASWGLCLETGGAKTLQNLLWSSKSLSALRLSFARAGPCLPSAQFNWENQERPSPVLKVVV